MRENRPYGSEGGEAKCLPDPYRFSLGDTVLLPANSWIPRPSLGMTECTSYPSMNSLRL